jgi:hypothetical protein
MIQKMGIFESSPPIQGNSTPLTSLEQNYFSKVNTLLHKYYTNNLYSDYNLEVSLQKKSFDETQMVQEHLEDISWLDYILKHLKKVKRNINMTWAVELEELLLKESFLYKNSYLSDFFYKEYNLKTFPKVLNNNIEYIFDNELNNDNNTTKKKKENLNKSTNSSQITNGPYNELDVTSNLGGSYIDIKMDSLPPNDPTFKYVLDRKLVKEYIKIFKRHIYKDKKHPINRTIVLFNKTFSKFIKEHIDDFKEKRKDPDLINEDLQNSIKKFEERITKCLQEFILTMNCSLKLFYSTCINFSFFKEEKDDLINLVISLFFKTGKLYETLFELYSLSYNNEIEILQEKLIDLKNIKPKILEITDKYCLDEVTLELQSKIIKEKQKEKKDNNNEIEIEDKKNNMLPSIKENDECIENEDDIIKKSRTSDQSDIIPKFVFNNQNIKKEKEIKIYNKDDKISDEDDEDEGDYLLSKLKEEDISMDMKIEGEMDILRKTINNFNSKKYLFPQIRNKIRDTLAQNEQYIQEAKSSGKLPMPYFSAINLLKKLHSFKTPFEKIIILAAINDQITESVMSFWSTMTKYIKSSFLFIEADELKAIFLYIFIQAQMPEIFVECKIITNFTTQQTRGFNISYNLSMTEASIEKIMEMKDTKEINKAEAELKEVKKSYAALATQRFSRLSRISMAENSFN